MYSAYMYMYMYIVIIWCLHKQHLFVIYSGIVIHILVGAHDLTG